MTEFHEKRFMDEKDDDDDEDDIDDDLDWLIEASEENENDTSSIPAEKYNDTSLKTYQATEEKQSINSDEETDEEDDDLNEEDRIVLHRNTNMNDAVEGEEYNLKQRIEKANQELAAEESPREEERERRVGFKSKLIEDSLTDSSMSSISQSDDDTNDEDVDDDSENHGFENDISKELDELQLQSGDDAMKVGTIEMEQNLVVEKGGKFEYVEADGITNHLSNGEPTSSEAITPKQPSRPKSAPTPSFQKSLPRRPMSAAVPDYGRQKMSTKTFTYSEETKKRIKERAEERAKRESDERRRKKEEERSAKEEAEDVWRSWVERKDAEVKNRKRAEQEETKRKEERERKNPDEAEEAYQAWLKHKATQARRDRIMLQQQQIEFDEGWYTRDRRECNRAFRAWLRNKNELARKRKEEEHRLRRSTSREMRRTRKAQKLIDSLHEAQKFKQLDFYGYRI